MTQENCPAAVTFQSKIIKNLFSRFALRSPLHIFLIKMSDWLTATVTTDWNYHIKSFSCLGFIKVSKPHPLNPAEGLKVWNY
jgi:hypothetical protein